ncbi:UNVERIFIED_CONTAM: Ammonium transporter 3 member 3 [Sesamum latifolium]|uniref:Ammonium transporter 3 member 3 n=1 Tax=Sesamum latifolium TaxID=2727402 RepID=A0AAW2YEI9_9LAMI
MNKGDNAWQLTAATLVALQSMPGLVILYGGMVKKKWAINSSLMAVYAFAATLICWMGWGYRMAFGDKLVPFWGKPAVAVDDSFLLGQAFIGYFPTATMVWFQFGGVQCVEPQGWLAKMGVIDFAGGFVIHLSSGVAGFTAAYWVGPRSVKDRERFPPNNVLMMLGGAGLVWVGWTGFNGGAPYATSTIASLAVINTHVCAATSLVTWLLLDIYVSGKPSALGVVNGLITGLVCITPAAGVVQCWAAILMGLISGSLPWYTLMVLNNKMRLLRHVDDTFAIFHTHAVAGSLGGILTGLLAVPKLSRLFYMVPDWDNDCLHSVSQHCGHHLDLFVHQVVFPLRLSEEELQVGDDEVHGEVAYALWSSDGADHHSFRNAKVNSMYDCEADEYPSVITKTSSYELHRV